MQIGCARSWAEPALQSRSGNERKPRGAAIEGRGVTNSTKWSRWFRCCRGCHYSMLDWMLSSRQGSNRRCCTMLKSVAMAAAASVLFLNWMRQAVEVHNVGRMCLQPPCYNYLWIEVEHHCSGHYTLDAHGIGPMRMAAGERAAAPAGVADQEGRRCFARRLDLLVTGDVMLSRFDAATCLLVERSFSRQVA